jgi:hypothetical protein
MRLPIPYFDKGENFMESPAIKTIDDMTQPELVQLVMDSFRRTLVHYGFWMGEVAHQVGLRAAAEVEAEAGDLAWNIILKRLAQVLGVQIEEGVPQRLKQMEKQELHKLLEAVSINWLANDGVWFQTVERHYGMDTAKRCNDTCWTRFSPYEAIRIKKLLNLSEQPGLAGLKEAIGFRLYARINKQSLEDLDNQNVIFRMNECRVQVARKRKGLPDYPCKSAGLVEYPGFASAIDARIQTECVGCPPDAHPEDWWCAWKFTLRA